MTSDEESDDRDNELRNDGMDEQVPELAPINERPQWQQPHHSSMQPQRPQQQQNVEFSPGYKRHLRSNSLKDLSDTPVEKRYGRVGRTSGAFSTSAQGPGSSLDDMSVILASIDEEKEEECARVVYSVGDVPTTFVSSMESSDARK